MPYFELPRLGGFWMDALSVMSFVAGATQRVGVDASVLVVPYHHPLVLAKALSTIDVLSGGRLVVSVGVGHAQQEFQVLNVAFPARGAITDETLDAVVNLWTSEEPYYAGEHFRIEGLAFEPKPIQQPRPPIHVGGNSKPALRRAARFEGWQPNPTNFLPADVPPLLDYIRSQESFTGKDETFSVSWVGTLPRVERKVLADLDDISRSEYRAQILAGLAALEAVGITTVGAPLPISRSMQEYIECLDWFDEEIIGTYR
jgi:probable F420-dependent oxidoreductase